jgi:hypothetical protein
MPSKKTIHQAMPFFHGKTLFAACEALDFISFVIQPSDQVTRGWNIRQLMRISQ